MNIFEEPTKKPNEYLERLRQLIVTVDDCLEKGTLNKLDEELNRQVRYILIQEEEKVEPEVMDVGFMDFSGFMAAKMKPKFGMNPLPENKPRTNKRFEHFKLKKDAEDIRTNKEPRDTQIW